MLNKVYFKGLNGIRFIAATLVILHHIEQLKRIFGLKNYFDNPFIHHIGNLGVILFFVLSGFLITFLLLKEEQVTSTIAIKEFYIRRILRIWPLYYFIILLSFFILPTLKVFDIPILSETLNVHFLPKLLLFIAFLPNVALFLFPSVPYASQAWSVGVEEQFYLIWPLLIKKIRNRTKLLLSIIASYLIIKFALLILVEMSSRLNGYIKLIYLFWDNFNIDCMAIGGFVALLLFKKDKRKLSFLFGTITQVITLLTLVISLGVGFEFPYVNKEIYAVLFSFLILNIAGNPKTIVNLENKVLNFLGKISYGLYMYHFIVIIVVIKLARFLSVDNNYFIYTSTIILTIAIATLSYYLLEKPFLKYKVKHSKILSGEKAGPHDSIQ